MAAKASAKNDKESRRLVCSNRKARFHYEIVETFEAGLQLKGTEVKVLRQGKMSIDEAFGRVIGDEMFLVGSHIQEYSHGNVQNHEPNRRRKMLLHRREIRRLKARSEQKGLTLVALEVFFNDRGLAKVTIAVCKGRKVHDKRDKLKSRDDQRAMRDA